MKNKKTLTAIQYIFGLISLYAILVVIIPSEIEKTATSEITIFWATIDVMKGGFISIASLLLIIFLEIKKYTIKED